MTQSAQDELAETAAASASTRVEASEQMTEEEAALYDRQLRLWGSEAQSRIRQARIVIAPFEGGVAAEVAKNLVLAGVKELILVDDGVVGEESLAAGGFIWRADDVGKKRVEAALPRLCSLNPHVTITPHVSPPTVESLTPLLATSPRSLVYCPSNPFRPPTPSIPLLSQLNDACRNVPPHASGGPTFFHLAIPQGLDGALFQDLGPAHRFLVEKKSTKRDLRTGATTEETWTEMMEQGFPTMGDVLADEGVPLVDVAGGSKAKAKRALRGSQGLWATLATWHLINNGDVTTASDLLDGDKAPALLVAAMDDLLSSRALLQTDEERRAAFWSEVTGPSSAPVEWAHAYLHGTIPRPNSVDDSSSADAAAYPPADIAPTCAVLGGIVAQEVLNAAGGRERPKVANWMSWYGRTGQAMVMPLGGAKVMREPTAAVTAAAAAAAAVAVAAKEDAS